MKLNFPVLPKCEFCKSRTAIGFIPDIDTFKKRGSGASWMWVCSSDDCPDGYIVEFARFFNSPAATVDWLAHLADKSWFDANKFCKMMERFRDETKCYNQV